MPQLLVTPCIISTKCQQAVSYLYSAAIGSYYNILALDLTDLPVPSSIKICYLSHSFYFFQVQSSSVQLYSTLYLPVLVEKVVMNKQFFGSPKANLQSNYVNKSTR